MLKGNMALNILGVAFASLGVYSTSHAAITSTTASASMQIQNQVSGSGIPNVSATNSSATSGIVDLTQLTTGFNVHSSMVFSSLTSESAVFDFSIGMHSNSSYSGQTYMGTLGSGYYDQMGLIRYHATADLTATVNYDFDLTGSNIFGMNPVYFYRPDGIKQFNAQSWTLTPPVNFSGTETFNLLAGHDYEFRVVFGPNVNGPLNNVGFKGPIDGDYSGRFTFNFGPVTSPVPEPETYAMLLAGLGLLGFTAKRKKQSA